MLITNYAIFIYRFLGSFEVNTVIYTWWNAQILSVPLLNFDKCTCKSISEYSSSHSLKNSLMSLPVNLDSASKSNHDFDCDLQTKRSSFFLEFQDFIFMETSSRKIFWVSLLSLWGWLCDFPTFLCVSVSHYLHCWEIFPLHEYITACVSTDGHLGSFRDLKIMDKAPMSILASLSWWIWIYLFSLLQ